MCNTLTIRLNSGLLKNKGQRTTFSPWVLHIQRLVTLSILSNLAEIMNFLRKLILSAVYQYVYTAVVPLSTNAITGIPPCAYGYKTDGMLSMQYLE